MRAIYIFNYLLILFLYSCTTVEVAKEITKVTSSVKTSIQKISNENEEITDLNKEVKEEELKKEKQKIITEKKKTKEVITKQSQITKIEIIGKNIDPLKMEFGTPNFASIDGNTKTMVFNIKQLVSYVSHFMTLYPGDIIATGTPPGVGAGMKPQKFLKHGDEMHLGIEKLGEQCQKVVKWK